MQTLTVADALSRELVTVGPHATVDDIARTMLEHHVHRVLVCEDHVLLGPDEGVATPRERERGSTASVGPSRRRRWRIACFSRPAR
jgi:CBS domain-containing protein